MLLILTVPTVDLDGDVSLVTVCSVDPLVCRETDSVVAVDVVELLTLPASVVPIDEEV